MFIWFSSLSVHHVVAGECRRGRVGVLQRPSLVPDAGADDAFGARPDGRKQSTDVPHPLGGASSRVHRGQKRLHRDQVQLPAAAGWHRPCRHPWGLHPWGQMVCRSMYSTPCVFDMLERTNKQTYYFGNNHINYIKKINCNWRPASLLRV